MSRLRRPCLLVIAAIASITVAPLKVWDIERLAVAGEQPARANKAFNPNEVRAFNSLKQICDFGPRPSGSEGMQKQQEFLKERFSELGGQVAFQDFDVAHPKKGTPVRMRNLIVSWQPKAKERVLLCCHYDTRPYPDRDTFRPKGTFLGANDGASGVALFLEMAHAMPNLQPTYGVDFVLFDGEEFIFERDGGKYFLGSEHFAKQYRDRPPSHRYVCGVLVDMIGDKNLTIYQECNSLKFAPAITRSIWETARTLGVKEFIAQPKHKLDDDHIPLNEIAKIPTTDLIDFDYPAWHTTRDKPSECSGASLVKVARVLLAWLENVPK
jgi:glutaminyl-peptide cyclotransferase